jgi:hypothetical protein
MLFSRVNFRQAKTDQRFLEPWAPGRTGEMGARYRPHGAVEVRFHASTEFRADRFAQPDSPSRCCRRYRPNPLPATHGGTDLTV